MTQEIVENVGGYSSFLSPFFIFFLVLAMHFLDQILVFLNKAESRSMEQAHLQQEIKKLLREANSLTTPSTFAQAAKLRRQAAAKEKELSKSKQRDLEDSSKIYKISALIKGIVFLLLYWKFWGIPVVRVPRKLLRPFGRLLTWKAADPTTGLVPVGIVPWLVITSLVSSFLSLKLSRLLDLSKAT